MENNNVKLEFATMALMGKRYNEAESIYMQVATEDNSAEAWMGMTICKLFQLANGKSMQEVVFCIEKALKISPEHRAEIENSVISNCQILLNAYIEMFGKSISDQKTATKQFIIGGALAAVSAGGAIASKSTFGKVTSLVGAGAGGAVAVDAFQQMDSADKMQIFILEKCSEINDGLRETIDSSNPNYIEFEKTLQIVIADVKKTVINRDKIKSEKWYDNKTYLILATIFFFPLGIYGWYMHYKNK